MRRRSPALDLVLVVLGTARLTRLVTRDWIAEWALIRPAKRWAAPYEWAARTGRPWHQAPPDETFPTDEPLSGQGRLVHGLECPYCVGFWLGLIVIVGTATIGKLPVAGTLWRIGLAALSLNYVTAHVVSRLDK